VATKYIRVLKAFALPAVGGTPVTIVPTEEPVRVHAWLRV